MKKTIEASMAIAEAVKLCRPLVIPMYPITPQTHIVERLSDFINDGDLDAEMIHVESEHSAISAAIGVIATGARVFTATASQGIALMHEILFIVSGLRLPIVMVVANRALSAPINIWNDQQDSISERDSGWLQFYAESAQEALDLTIMSYKIAEDHKVLLPVMVCIDGFVLSHLFEQVDMPSQKEVDSFLPSFKPYFSLDPAKPITIGPIGFPKHFQLFKKQQQDAMLKSLSVIKKVQNDFYKKFKRKYSLIESYKLKGAKTVIVGMGTLCGTARVAVDEMKNVGLVKITCFRPFPKKELIKALKGKKVVVIDRNISFGMEGALVTELKSILPNVKGVVTGLGGKDITKDILKKSVTAKDGAWL